MPQITLPYWLFALLVALAAWSVIAGLFLPSVRWYLRRRASRTLDEVAARLKIRIEPFRLTKRQVLVDRLLYDPQVVDAAEAWAAEQGVSRDVALSKVEEYAREIVPAFNAYFYFRIGYALARGAAKLLYRVRLGSSDEAALAAIPPKSTVVFLMNHRSNMDYILVSFLASERSALSYAVGEWARIWPVEQLVRATGAYFVRRNSKDPLYRKVLGRYVQMATQAGVTQAAYPEGRLSRDGKLGTPRLGLLDYIVRGFEPESERDVAFIPVGINYDRVLEDRTLLLDLAPGAKRAKGLEAMEKTLDYVVKNLQLMALSRWHRFGYAAVSFGAPISLRQYLDERSLHLGKLDKEERFEAVGALGEHLMAAIARSVPVLPVALVASVFARQPERRFTELELKATAAELLGVLKERGACVYLPRRDEDYAVTAGLRVLVMRRAVTDEEGLLRARPEELPLLRYYANSIAHLLPA